MFNLQYQKSGLLKQFVMQINSFSLFAILGAVMVCPVLVDAIFFMVSFAKLSCLQLAHVLFVKMNEDI